MDRSSFTARSMHWAQVIRSTGDPLDEQIAGMLAAMELRKQKGERRPRKRQAPNASVVDRLTGRPGAGSRFYLEEKERA